MGLLSKDAIKAANDSLSKEIEVPEWGGSIKIKLPSALECESFTKAQMAGNYMEALVAMCAAGIVDENGNRMFVTVDEIAALGSKSMDVLARIRDAIDELGNRTKLEDLVKNSPATTTSDSCSESAVI